MSLTCCLCVILNTLLRPPVRIPGIPPLLAHIIIIRAVTFTNKQSWVRGKWGGAHNSHVLAARAQQLLFLHPLIFRLSQGGGL